MGLRTTARDVLKKVFGESFYGELRGVYRNARYGDRSKLEGRVSMDLKHEAPEPQWKEVGASTYKWVPASEVHEALPDVVKEPRVAPADSETDLSEEQNRPLLCEKFLVQDRLLIDYVDKSGNATRRPIRVEEVYAYDDGVFVLRAWCLLRKGYRTFVSTRIKGCRDAFSKEMVFDLLSRLRKRSLSDPGNVAQEILDGMTLEIVISIYTLMNYSTGKGYEKRFVSGKKKNALADWVLKQSKAESLLSSLDADKHSEIEELVRESIGDIKATQSSYESCARALKRTRYIFSNNDGYEVRRQDLILFVERALEGEAARDTALTRLKQDLLDPSFRIGREVDIDMFMEEFSKVKKDSKKAEKKYKRKKKPEVISKQYRRYERGEPVRLLAIEVAQRNLQQCLDDDRLLFGKDEFEECVMREVEFAFTEEELKKAGEMFRKRCGAGLSTAYCSFGLRKEKRSWFTDSRGKSWLDLKTRVAA